MRMPRHLGRVSLLAVLSLVAGQVLASPASATFPGPDGRIAFFDFDTGQIFSINPDGTGLRQLTHVTAPSVAAQPDWSPDGRQITFSSDLSGQPRLYVMDRDGSHQQPVFSDLPGYNDYAPQFTPDAGRLVFQRCTPNIDSCAIYSVATSGTHLRALTPFRAGLDVFDVAPSVSPDGRRIAFARFNAGGIQAQVYVMAADGAGEHAITPPVLEAFAADWTPDGRHILVGSDCCRLNGAIYQVKPDGTGLKRLTRPQFPHSDNLPSAAPRGDRIVFSSDRPYPDVCCRDLFTMRADGSGLRRVPTGLVGAADADWGTAPPDTAPVAAVPRAPAHAEAPTAKACLARPELRILERCGAPRRTVVK
jgi:Tol biopolymer transport system component